MLNVPEKVSPLHDLTMPRAPDDGAGVQLSERLCGSLVQVQAWPDTIDRVQKTLAKTLKLEGELENTAVAGKDLVIMPSGPARWLVDSDGEGLEEQLRGVISADLGAVTGLTHARVVVSISGAKAEWVLASGIAIDFDASSFPIGHVCLTHHHEIGVTIHRTADESFDLYVFTSLARSFWQWIERASAEVGYGVG